LFSSHDRGRATGKPSCSGKLLPLAKLSGELDDDNNRKFLLRL
jgi:hypothetical protein